MSDAPQVVRIPPPPDIKAENAMLRYRAYAAESAINECMRALKPVYESMGAMNKALFELNAKYPLNDNTQEGVKALAINAARAANADTATMTDAEVETKYLKGGREGDVATSPPR